MVFRQPRKASPWFLLTVLVLLFGSVRAEGLTPLYPEASGTRLFTNKAGTVTVDASNADQGYIMVRHSGSKMRLKTVIAFDGVERRYDLNGEGRYETFPLARGSGNYAVSVLEQVDGSSYAMLFGETLSVTMPDPTAAFLYPNQYVWYTPESAAVAKSMELCEGIGSDWQKLEVLYDYVSRTVMYDHVKAVMVQTQKGYLPNVDETLATKAGICFDYAALLACMLRVQGIPTQLAMGNLTAQNPPVYHAWNKVYINGTWVMLDATFPNANFKQSEYVEDRLY